MIGGGANLSGKKHVVNGGNNSSAHKFLLD
jgi:hypothetical protein